MYSVGKAVATIAMWGAVGIIGYKEPGAGAFLGIIAGIVTGVIWQK